MKKLILTLSLSFAALRGQTYTADGQLVRPDNYREWIFLSSGLGMTYGPAQSAEARFDNVFVTPAAYQSFLKTGTWPDKTMFVLEVRSAASKGSINKDGHYQEEVVAVEVHLKDTSRFAGGWEFFGFKPGAQSAKAIGPKSSCQTCHSTNGAVDHTFVQFYPTLIPIAKAKGTLKAEAQH